MEPRATKLADLLRNEKTPLSKDEQRNFNLWALLNDVPLSNDYNMQGFYKSQSLPNARASEINTNDGRIHFPDTFKLPNHETFSTDSGYYNPDLMKNTPTWIGGNIGNTNNQSWSLRRPNGSIVKSEAPWLIDLLRK